MLKTMLFRGTGISGSESWALYFNKSTSEIHSMAGISTICIGKKGVIYIGGSAYGIKTSEDTIKNSYFAKINTKGEILWQNYFRHKSNNTTSAEGYIDTIGDNIIIGGQDYSLLKMKDTQLGLCSANGDKITTVGITASGLLGVYVAPSILGINFSDNNIYVYGKNYLAKLTKDLSNADWIKPLTSNSINIKMRYDPDSNCIFFSGNLPTSNDKTIFCVGSLSSTGEQRWIEAISNSDGRSRNSVCITSDGVYTCSEPRSTSGNSYGIFAKHTKSGSLLWIKEIVKDSYYLTPYSSCSDSAGNIYIGCVSDFGYIIKLSPDGDVLSNIKIIDSNNTTGGTVYIRSINIDAKGNLYAYMSSPNERYLVKLTKSDLTRITTTVLTIGPLTFKNDSSIGTSPSSHTSESYNKKIIDTSSTNFSLTSSTFTFVEANVTPELYYKG